MSETLANELIDLMKREDLKQNEISNNTNIPETTLSGYIKKGYPISTEKALKILKENGDSIFAGQLSYKFLGFLKSMDGKLAEVCTTAELDIFQKMESNERKERKQRAELLIVQNKVRRLDEQEHQELEQYAMEFLDEIVVELAIVFSILDIVNLDIREAVEAKMPEWISKSYMKG